MSVALGNLETQFFAYVQLRRLKSVRTGELTGPLGITPTQERELLSRLARRGLITRVRRGLYLVPPRLPPGGKWSPGEFSALSALIDDRAGRYQICGPNAFYRYGWDDQVPNRIYAYNNRLSGERKIGSVALTLIKVADERLGETEVFQTPDGVEAVYSSRTRTLVDAIYDWSRFGSLPRAYAWIRTELAEDQKAATRLVKVAIQYGNVSTLRRLGKLLELEGVKPSLLRRLEAEIPRSSALIPWVPTYLKRGTVDRRWGVLFNDQP
jgi:predicted transcriptional regulator of viral defense system